MKKIRAQIIFDEIIEVEEEYWNEKDWITAWEDDIYLAIDNFKKSPVIKFEEIN